eukprot:1285977-Rhodomonas_salina.3
MSKGDDKNIGTSLDEISRILQEGDLSEVEKLKLIRQTLPPRVFPDETEPGLSGETLVARSFADLNDLLFLDSWEDSSKKYRPLKLFRGSSDASMGLRTSLQRLIKHTDSKSALGKMETRRIEEGMIDSFKKCVPLPLAAPSYALLPRSHLCYFPADREQHTAGCCSWKR